MKMKLGKVLTVTAFATGITLGAFVDLAEARRRGKYTSNGQDQRAIGATFDLFDQNINEQPIIDSTIVNSVDTDFNLGFFEGAIGNYFAIRENDLSLNDIPVADILLSPGQKVAVADLQAKLSPDSNFITYEILQQDGRLIEDFQLSVEENLFFTDEFLEIEVSVPNFDKNRAVNDIAYILDNNLLSATLPSLNRFPPGTLLSVLPDTVFGGIEGTNTTINTVPESNMTGSLLILGALGTSLLLKPKLKNNLA